MLPSRPSATRPRTDTPELYQVVQQCWWDRGERWSARALLIRLRRELAAAEAVAKEDGLPIRDVGATVNGELTEQVQIKTRDNARRSFKFHKAGAPRGLCGNGISVSTW